MKDNITTIPISEIFETKDGCPVCRLRDAVEARTVDFILGGAMMEPDVRIMTNDQGFCKTHFDQMLQKKNKLAVALMLDSHLGQIDGVLSPGGFMKKSVSAKFPLARAVAEDCFICRRTQWGLEHLLDTLVKTWAKESDFRKLFADQPIICLPHYHALCETAKKSLNKKDGEKFTEAAAAVTRDGLTRLREDVRWFCDKHDYRNASADWGNARDAVERSVKFLTSR